MPSFFALFLPWPMLLPEHNQCSDRRRSFRHPRGRPAARTGWRRNLFPPTQARCRKRQHETPRLPETDCCRRGDALGILTETFRVQSKDAWNEGALLRRSLSSAQDWPGCRLRYELTQAGHDVTVLEARTRPGGRVHTLRDPFAEGLYAEAGAARIPNHHHFTLKYAELFGLTLDPFAAARYAVRLPRAWEKDSGDTRTEGGVAV